MSVAAAAEGGTAWATGWRDDSTDATAGPDDVSVAAAAEGGTAWATGWRDDSTNGTAGPGNASVAVGALAVSGSEVAAGAAGGGDAAAVYGAADARMAVDDGYRNTTEFLRARLRISAPEARRRLALAGDLLPRQGFSGNPLPPVREELGAAVAAGDVSSRAATIITLALDRVRHTCNPEAAAGMEHALTRTAAENDPDILARAARNWTDALDQDGAEPTEELLRQLQGAFIRKPRHGLQHLEIFATPEQFEHLLTVMNNATNPRTTHTGTPAAPEEGSAAGGTAACEGSSGAAGAAGTPENDPGAAAGTAACDGAAGTPENDLGAACLDLRSQPQKRLDGLVGAAKIALATGSLPAAGGLRPQVMVTIDYRDLLARLEHLTGNTDQPGNNRDDTTAREATTRSFRPGGPTGHTGTMLFTGPVTASTVRKIACDADIIPVLLGGEGRILDIGRASRVFPPHIRKALTARDQGCAFPGCTIPAPWCEAHHITYWSRGGPTGTENGTLLCSHHHHVIHKEQWTIQIRTGIPWFIPPPHIDPRQAPRRNYYFHPADLNTAA
ncbi:HNH endonuclease signature motif containing protein [Arthrobacter sp. U41]|uniref:HNH endonuclease signature motif containing protein n=1 Tax=Arthrobacter sp. U41 TaxID=1849032 RepID=UPI0021B52672|nr:HNH endonuclease signature motif containing protein [Arthrobacter sp. U41]